MPLIKQDSDTSSNISLDSLICVTNLQNEEEEGKSSDILSKVPTVQLEYKHEILEITSILYHLSNKNLIHGARNRNSSTVKRVKLNKGKLLRAYHKSKEILKNTTQNCYSFNRCLFDYLMTKSFQSVHRAASLDDQQFELQYDRVLERFYKIHKRQEATDKEVSTSLEVVFKIKASAKESLENVENGKDCSY